MWHGMPARAYLLSFHRHLPRGFLSLLIPIVFIVLVNVKGEQNEPKIKTLPTASFSFLEKANFPRILILQAQSPSPYTSR